MRIAVTGSSGHLGEALCRVLARDHELVGIDRRAGGHTDVVVDIADSVHVRKVLDGCEAVVHTATLHKPHVATHPWQAFVDTNVSGTLTLLEAAADVGVEAFVFTSTTSAYGRSLRPAPGQPAVWVTEDLADTPRNVYGVTKSAAEDLAELVHRRRGLPVVVLRTSRFFPEEDDRPEMRAGFSDDNLKANELLHRRVDLADVVEAHRCALERAEVIGFGRYVVSATTPFSPDDVIELRSRPSAVVARRFPEQPELYESAGWALPASIDRVYDNSRARRDLGWTPRHDFARVLDHLRGGPGWRSDLARAIGSRGYHETNFARGPYPVEPDDP